MKDNNGYPTTFLGWVGLVLSCIISFILGMIIYFVAPMLKFK